MNWAWKIGQGLGKTRARESVCHVFGKEGEEQTQLVGRTFVLVSSERGDQSNGWAPGRVTGKWEPSEGVYVCKTFY